MSPEEVRKIVLEEIEKSFLLVPEMVTALLQEKIVMSKLVEKFYTDNKDFMDHKDIVGSVIEEVESKNPGKKYEDILKKSTPIINERIKTVGKLDLKTFKKPENLTFDQGEI